jgi:type I restriction enzyme S subunit
MRSHNNQARLGDLLISLKTGLNPRSNFKLNTPGAKNWYITVKELNGTGVDFLPQTDRVDDDGLKRIGARSNLEVDDILFSGTGTIGKTAIVTTPPINWNIKEGVYVLKPNKKLLDPYFLLCQLRYYSDLGVFNNQTGGSTVFSVPMSLLLDTKFHLPLLDTQRQISTIVKKINHKIELNNKINAELEQMTKTLYDYWFVQFNFPNADGKPYKSSGGQMVLNEKLKREIPKDWQVAPMSELIELERGISYTSESIESGAGTPMINLGSISVDRLYRPEKLKFYAGNHAKRYESQPGELLIACTDMTRNGDIIGCPISTPYTHEKFVYSMDLAKVKFVSDSALPSYLYFTLRTDWYHKYIKRFASGTNVQHLDIKGVYEYREAIPPVELQQAFDNLFVPLNKVISNSLIENQKLAELRDWLLPMLMNGQVTVK